MGGSGGGAAIAGAMRGAVRRVSACNASLRVSRALRPALSSRRVNQVARSQCTPPQVQAPSRSMMVIQETPKAIATPAIHAASSSSVAPSRSSPDFRRSPVALPTTPPAPAGRCSGLQCSPVSAQLDTSTTTKPALRIAAFRRE